MTANSIHLRSLHFPGTPAEYSPPDRIVADFPADVLFTVARIQGALPPIVFTRKAEEANGAFYRFVSGEVANRFYEDGLRDALPIYDVFNPAHCLAHYPQDSKEPDSEQQILAASFSKAIGTDPAAADMDEVDRQGLAEVLAQTVIDKGWRKVRELHP